MKKLAKLVEDDRSMHPRNPHYCLMKIFIPLKQQRKTKLTIPKERNLILRKSVKPFFTSKSYQSTNTSSTRMQAYTITKKMTEDIVFKASGD